MRSARDKLRIDARLIDAASDAVVWSDSYDGQRDDVLSMQSAVSIDVVRALRVELSTAEQQSLDRALTGSTRAYELYAQASYLYSSVSPNEALARVEFLHWRWTEALRSFDLALETAPSDLHAVGSGGWLNALVGRRERAVRIAEHGVLLNPKVGEAHRWLGVVQGVMGDREAAAASLRTAHQIAPGDPFSAAWLAYMEIARGDRAEGTRLGPATLL